MVAVLSTRRPSAGHQPFLRHTFFVTYNNVGADGTTLNRLMTHRSFKVERCKSHSGLLCRRFHQFQTFCQLLVLSGAARIVANCCNLIRRSMCSSPILHRARRQMLSASYCSSVRSCRFPESNRGQSQQIFENKYASSITQCHVVEPIGAAKNRMCLAGLAVAHPVRVEPWQARGDLYCRKTS